MKFDKPIFDVIQEKKIPFLAAHRGVCGANIPCNSKEAFKIALDLKADVIELDVAKSKDGKFFVFHPYMEHAFLQDGILIKDLTYEEVCNKVLLNQDKVLTNYKVATLLDVFKMLKGKCYINVDKFQTDIVGITKIIRKAHIEKQVIVKTDLKDEYLDQVEKYCPDLMYMPLVWHKDEATSKLKNRNINYIGLEILFDSDDDPIIQDKFIKEAHDNRKIIWVNSIVYNRTDIISANHNDDISLTVNPDLGWGYLFDKKIDIIQTDWLVLARKYLLKKAKSHK